MTGRLGRRGLLLGAVLLTACGTGSDTSTGTKDALRFSTSNLNVAYVGEPYNADLQVAGGLSPYQVRLTDGALPDGLSLSGSTLAGTPSKSGVYTFSLEASDASLSTRAQKYTLTVSTQISFELRPTLPATGVVGDSRIPLIVNHPKGATAARFQWKLPAGARITAVKPGDGQPIVFWKQSGTLFTLDLGFRRVPVNGAQVALLSFKPKEPVQLTNAPSAYQGRDASGKLVGNQDFAPVGPTPGTSTGGVSSAGTSTGVPPSGTASDSTQGTSGTGTSTDSTSSGGVSTEGTSTTNTSSTATSTDGTSTVGSSTTDTSSTGASTQGSSTDASSGTGTQDTSTGGDSTGGGETLDDLAGPAPSNGTSTDGGSK